MDGSKFDALTKGLATGRSRRSVLRGLLGGGAAVVAARTGDALAAPAPKVTICHFTSSATNPYNIITISSNALAQHQANHGDFIFTDCCLDSDCDEGEACEEGTCEPVFSGTTCDTKAGICTASAVCDGGPCVCFFSFVEGDASGQRYCFAGEFNCTGDSCSDNLDCAPGFGCASTCCNVGGTGFCRPLCSTDGLRIQSESGTGEGWSST